MRRLERLTYGRLAGLLAERGGVASEAIAAVLAEAERASIPFPEALVREGLVPEPDLAALVAEEFNLPLFPIRLYLPDRDLLALFPADFLLRHLLVPLDRFSGVLTLAMPALTPGPVLAEARERGGLEILPVVGFPSENRRFLEGILQAPRADPPGERGSDDGRGPGLGSARAEEGPRPR